MPALGLALGLPFNRGGGASAFVGPLDALTAKVWVSYGLTRHFAGIADSTRVRESGGDTEEEIGTLATGGYDTAEFASFVGVNDGFGRYWRDQKDGNTGSDVGQATAANQPQVIIASNLNALPALRFAGEGMNFALAGSNLAQIGTDDFEFWSVGYLTSSTSYRVLAIFSGANTIFFSTSAAGSGNASGQIGGSVRDFGSAVTLNAPHILRFYRHSGVVYCDIDGVTCGSSFASTDSIADGAVTIVVGDSGGTGPAGDMAEWIVFNAALTSGEASALKAHFASLYDIPVS